jgi:hypothetical protein
MRKEKEKGLADGWRRLSHQNDAFLQPLDFLYICLDLFTRETELFIPHKK